MKIFGIIKNKNKNYPILYPLLNAIIIVLAILLLSGKVSALPDGATVVSGQAQFKNTGGNNLNITTSNKVIINYNSFNIGKSESVNFIQPNSSSVALNRVIGIDPSDILGSLNSNGIIFLVNPNGILFGKGSVVNTGSFLASTLDISNSDFLNGKYNFNIKPGFAPSYIINRGLIQANAGGFVVLASPLAVNEGSIVARQGNAVIAGVSHFTISFNQNGLISFVVPEMYGENGDVLVPVGDIDNIIEDVVNMDGIVEANNVVEQNGDVTLVNTQGTAINAGTVNVNGFSGVNAGKVMVDSTANTDLTGGSSINANGIGSNSSGGMINILSQGNTYFLSGALLEAKGGGISGNGGFIEISAEKNALLDGGIFNASAVNGDPGNILIDPANLDISTNQILSGSNASFQADDSITVDPNIIISTRNIGASTDYSGAASTGNSGSITLTSPDITIGSGAELLSFANNGYTGGDITLTATAVPTTDTMAGTTAANADIAINGATLDGNNISITAAANSTNTFNDSSAPVSLSSINLPNTDISIASVNAAASISTAGAQITVGAGTNINASGNLTIQSTATTSAAVSLTDTAAGIAYGESNPTATVDVQSGSDIYAGGSAVIGSTANSTADIKNPSLNLENLNNAVPLPATFAYLSAGVTASSTVDSGAEITTSGNFSVESSTTKTLTASDSASPYADSSGDAIGASIAIIDSTTSTTAELSGNASIGGDLTVQATDTTTTNKITADSSSSVPSTDATAEISPFSTGAGNALITNDMNSFQGDSQSSSSDSTPDSQSGGTTVGLSASFAYDEYTTNSQAYIGPDAVINVTGAADSNGNNVNVLSNVDYPDVANTSNAILAGVTADVNTDYGAAGAILITDFTNNSSAYIGNNATVNAGAGIDVDSEIYIPYTFPYTSIWGGSTPQSVSDIKTAITDIKGFVTNIPSGLESDGFFSTYAQSASSSSKIGVAGSVNYLSMTNNNYADIDSGAHINPDSSSSYRTGSQDVTVNANTDVETVNASGIVGPKGLGTSGGDAGVGGSYLQVNYNNTTKAEVENPASLYSNSLTVTSNTTDRNISIAVAGGSAGKFCLTGTFSLLDTNNTTLADIDNSSGTIQSGPISIDSTDGSQLWNISGGVAKASNAGIGASISLNNITRDTEAAINDSLSNPNGTLSSTGDIILNAENSGEIYSFSLAGSYSSSSPSSSSDGSGSSSDPQTAENSSSSDGGGQYGLAVSGDASVNTISDTALAYVKNADITDAAGLSSTAENNSDIFAVAGSASLSVSSSGSAGIAGSYTQNTLNDTADAYIDASTLTVSGNIGLNAYTEGIIATLSAGGSGATGDISAALAGSVSVNSIDNDTEGYIDNSYVNITAGGLTINADNTPEIDAIAGSADFATNGGIGAGVALNTIGGKTYSYLNDSEVDAVGNISLDSKTNATINAISASASLTIADDPDFSAAGAVSINTISGGETESYISGFYNGKGVTAQDVSLSSADSSSIFSIAGNVSVSIDTDYDSGFISAAAGASVAYNDIGNDVMSYITNSSVTATSGNVEADSESNDTIITGSAGVSAGLIGLAGSVVINNDHNDIESYIDNSTVTAYDDVALLSNAGNTVDVYGGAIAAGALGAGGSATVNNINNTIKSYISGSSDVNAEGNAAISVPKADGTGSYENIQGLAVIAESSEDVSVYTANISGGGDAIAADASVTLLGDHTDAYIDSSTVNGSNGSANPAQAAEVKAYNGSSVNVYAGAAAVAGTGVGATSDTTLLSNSTQAYINASTVNAADAVNVTSGSSETENDVVISGVMASGYSVAGSVGVIELNDNDDAYISGSTVNSGGDLNVAANDSATLNPIAGSLTYGGVSGASGSVIVASIGNNTDAYISDSTTNAAGLTDVTSTSTDDITDYGATLRLLSGIDAAGSVIVNTIDATTLAYIDGGAGASVNGNAAYKNSNQNVDINADNTSTVDDTSGEVNVGFAAVGASIDVDSINNTTNAYAGTNSDINAGGSLDITANSQQYVNSIVVAFGGAAISVQGAVSVVDIGSGMTTGTYGSSTASGSTGSVVSGQISADSTNNQLGNTTLAADTDSDVSAATGSLSVSGDFNTSVPVNNSTSSYIGSGAVINTGSDILVNSNNATNVNITSGAGSAAGTYGVGGAVGIAAVNPTTNAFADSGSSLTAGGSVTIEANGTVDNSAVKTYTGTAGLVGIGAAVSYLNSNNDVSAFIGQSSSVNASGNLSIISNATTNTDADAYGASLALGAAGVTIANASETGTNEAYIGQYANAEEGSLTVDASSNENINALSQAASGGVGSVTGTSATAVASPTVNAYIDNDAVVKVLNDADVEASLLISQDDSNAQGISIGGITVGVSSAETDANPSVSAYLGDDGDITATSGDISIKSIYNYDSGGSGISNSLGADASASTGGTLLPSAAGADSETNADVTVLAYTGTGSSLSAGNDVNVNSEAYNSINSSSTGITGGLLTGGGVQGSVNTVTLSTAMVGQSSTVSADNNISIGSDAESYANIIVTGGFGQSLSQTLQNLFQGSLSNVQMPSFIAYGGGGANVSMTNNAQSIIESDAVLTAKNQMDINSNAVASANPYSTMTAGSASVAAALSYSEADIYSNSLIQVDNGAGITGNDVSMISDDAIYADVQAISHSTADILGAFASAKSVLNVGQGTPSTSQVIISSGVAITGYNSITMTAENEQNSQILPTSDLTSYSNAWATTNTVAAVAYSEADGSVDVGSTVEIDSGSTLTTPNISVTSQSDYTLKRDPEVSAKTVVWFTTVTTYVQEHICSWLPWPLNKLCSWVTKEVTSVVEHVTGAVGVNKVGGDGFIQNDQIIMNGDIYTGSSSNQILIVNQNGTIDPSSNIGATIDSNNVDVNNITNNTQKSVNFDVPNGTLSGNGTIYFNNIYPLVEIENNSDKNLTINQVQMIDSNNGQPDFTVEALNDNSNFTITSENLSSSLIIQNNYPDPNLNIYFNDPIENINAGFNILNQGGSILANNSSVLLEAGNISLDSANGDIGSASQSLNLELFNSGSVTPSYFNATAYGSMYLGATVINYISMPADYQAAYLNDTAYSNYITGYNQTISMLETLYGWTQTQAEAYYPYVNPYTYETLPSDFPPSSSVTASGFDFNNISAFGNININLHNGIVEYTDPATGNLVQDVQGGLYNINSILAGGGVVFNEAPDASIQLGNTISGTLVNGSVTSGLENIGYMIDSNGSPDPSNLFNFASSITSNQIILKNINYSEPESGNIDITGGNIGGSGTLEVLNGYSDVNVTNNSAKTFELNNNIDAATPANGAVNINGVNIPLGSYGAAITVKQYGYQQSGINIQNNYSGADLNANLDATGNINLSSAGDLTVNDGITSGAGNILLSSDGNFTQSAGTLITSPASVTVSSGNDLTVNGTVNGGNDILAAGTDNTINGTVNSTSSASISAGNDVNLNGAIDGSYITLGAGTDINLNGDISTYNASGNANPYVTIKADSDGSGTGSINWTSGTIDTGGGLYLYAAGNIGSQSSPVHLSGAQSTVIQEAKTTNAGAGIYITGTEGLNAGSIQSNGGTVILHSDDYIGSADTSITNITANDLIISASNGIGSANALNTDVSYLDALNTSANDIGINNGSGLTLEDLNADGYAVKNNGGKITISATGPMNVSGNVYSLGGVNLSSAGDLTVNDGITSGAGNILLSSDGNFTQSAGTLITSPASVTVSSGNDLTVNGTVNGGNDILAAGTDNTINGTVNSTSSASISAGNDVNLNGAIDGSYITLGAGTDINLNGDISTYNASGNANPYVTIKADSDGNGTGSINWTSGTIDTGGGLYLYAAGNIGSQSSPVHLSGAQSTVIQEAKTTNAGAGIYITGTEGLNAGSIQSNGGTVILHSDDYIGSADTSITNITANDLIISASNGIGSANALNTDVSYLDALNTSANDIGINNGSGLTLEDLNADGYAVKNNGGKITISATGPMNVSGNVYSLGGVNLSSAGDLTVNDGITSGAGNILLSSDGNFTQSAGTLITSPASVTVSSGNDLTVNGTVNGGNDILAAGTDNTINGTVNSTSSASISAGNDVNLNGAIDGSYITLGAGTDINLNGDISTYNASGNANPYVTIKADSDGSGTGSINWTSGTIDTGGGLYLYAAGNIGSQSSPVHLSGAQSTVIQEAKTTNAGAGIYITGTEGLNAGSIQSNGGTVILHSDDYIGSADTSITNITANDLIISASNGIGSANALNTDVSYLDALNTSANDIGINNGSGLTLEDLNADGYAVKNNGGKITISATGPMNVSGNVYSLGGVNLSSAGDLTVNDGITSGAGNILLSSDGNFTQSAGTINSVEGKIDINAYNDLNGEGGNIFQYGTARVISKGPISLKALDNVTLTYLFSETTGVDIYALRGSIMDGANNNTSIYAYGDSHLWAGYIIGKYDNPLNVDINGGNLYLYGGGQLRLISADIYGIVQPSNMVKAFYATSPGLLLFNNRPMGGKIINEYLRLTRYWEIPTIYELLHIYKPELYGFVNYDIMNEKPLPFSWVKP